MPDPIRDLESFPTDGVPVSPLPASEVRRRGDRLRRRHHALSAVAGVAAVAAVAVPVAVVAGGTGGERSNGPDVVAPSETALPSPSLPGALSAQDLLTDRDTVFHEGADWYTVATHAGDGQDSFHPCARESLRGLGAEASFQRDFELRAIEGQSPSANGDWMRQQVAEFPDAAGARGAYDAMTSWVARCEGQIPGAARYRTDGPTPLDTGTGEATYFTGSHGQVEGDGLAEPGHFMDTGLVLLDDRISVVTTVVVGQDHDFTPDELPVVRMLPRAAQLLERDHPVESSPSATAAATDPPPSSPPVSDPVPSEPPTNASSPSPTAATTDTCDVHGLELRLDGQESAAGTTWYRVSAHNTGGTACRLATLWTVEHRLYEHERVGPSLVRKSPALLLEPGESVRTRVGVTSFENHDAAACRPAVIDNIHVGWGDPDGAWTINRDSQACTTDIQLLRMDPWRAG